jgi:hypothetical protein
MAPTVLPHLIPARYLPGPVLKAPPFGQYPPGLRGHLQKLQNTGRSLAVFNFPRLSARIALPCTKNDCREKVNHPVSPGYFLF